MRKITQENRDLANSLRQEMLAIQRAARAQPAPTTTKKKPQGSTRGSEERQTSVSAAPGPRGQKRLREQDLEKVSLSSVSCLHLFNMRFIYSHLIVKVANVLP